MFKIPAHENVLLRLGEGGKNPLSPEFSILVWNIYKGQRGDHFREDFKALAQGKDFILIQEAMVDEHIPKLWKESFAGYQWSIAQSFQFNKNQYTTGVCIGSHWEPTHIEYIRAKSREFFWLTPKISLFSEFSWDQTRILLICTHVLNFVTIQAFIHSLVEIAKKISEFSGPVILAGDFNTWNVKRYLAMKEIFHDLGLEHVNFERDRRLLRLDHVFTRGFRVEKALIHHTVSSSDHLPLEIKLRLGD